MRARVRNAATALAGVVGLSLWTLPDPWDGVGNEAQFESQRPQPGL